MTYRQVVCRNPYHLGHVEPILAKKLMVVGQNVVMILVLYQCNPLECLGVRFLSLVCVKAVQPGSAPLPTVV